MFNKDKWLKINLYDYQIKKQKESSNNNSIIGIIDQKIINSIEKKGNLLNGIPFAIKDNIAIKGLETTSASKIIRNLISNYDSTVFKKLVEQGAIPLFKSNLDELAMGGTGLTSNYGPVYNPFNKDYISGGSSSGSNYLVANGTVPFSIGTDTGDSIRKPASYTGVVGFKPTWGLVSRYGVYDFAPSWDTVGWFTNTVKESALLMDVLKGYDEKDQTSIKTDEKNYLESTIKDNSKFKIVVIPDIEDQIKDIEVKNSYFKALDLLKKDGHKIIEADDVKKDILETIFVVYNIVSSVEAFSCNSNLTGFHFGFYFDEGKNYEEKIINARTKGFGYEVKKRFLISQESKYSENNEYIKALKMRRLINDELNRILSLGDGLIVPSTPDLAHKADNLNEYKFDHLLNNILTLFNSNGSPSLTLPIIKNRHLSTSINISAKPFKDKEVFKIANRLEELINE